MNHKGLNQWVWVYSGDVGKSQYMKREKGPYYELEALWGMNENDWLDRWHRSQYDFPSTKKYFHWKERYHGGYVRNKKLLSQSYELLYDKRQVLAVKTICQHEKDERTFPRERRYIRTRLHEKLADFHRFLRLYIAIEELKELSNARMTKRHERLPKRVKKSKGETRAELRSYYKLVEKPRLEREVKKLLNEHHYTVQKLQDWRFWLARQSHLNDGSIFRESSRSYLAALDDAALIRAEDTNYMIWILNWFLYLLTGNEETVRGIVGGWIGQHCRFCHRAYEPSPNRREEQETCGREECTAKLRNLHRKPKRRKDTK